MTLWLTALILLPCLANAANDSPLTDVQKAVIMHESWNDAVKLSIKPIIKEPLNKQVDKATVEEVKQIDKKISLKVDALPLTTSIFPFALPV